MRMASVCGIGRLSLPQDCAYGEVGRSAKDGGYCGVFGRNLFPAPCRKLPSCRCQLEVSSVLRFLRTLGTRPRYSTSEKFNVSTVVTDERKYRQSRNVAAADPQSQSDRFICRDGRLS